MLGGAGEHASSHCGDLTEGGARDLFNLTVLDLHRLPPAAPGGRSQALKKSFELRRAEFRRGSLFSVPCRLRAVSKSASPALPPPPQKPPQPVEGCGSRRSPSHSGLGAAVARLLPGQTGPGPCAFCPPAALFGVRFGTRWDRGGRGRRSDSSEMSTGSSRGLPTGVRPVQLPKRLGIAGSNRVARSKKSTGALLERRA